MYGSYWDEDWSSGGAVTPTGSRSPWLAQFPTQTTVVVAPTWLPSQSYGNAYEWVHAPPPGPSAAERKAAESRARASSMASDALHGIQPRNNHHRTLRGFSDAPRRPVYRGSRGGR